MKMKSKNSFSKFRPHPWHGISPGKNPPKLVTAYIEITPADGMKYEIDKETGYLKVDRPQRTSSLPPALYGFIPQTYCGDRVKKLAPRAKRGDGDPLDICVLSERPITRNEILVPARVIGGLRMIDKEEADDKIIAVLESDPFWDEIKDLSDLSNVLKSRLEHYFMTYKMIPGGKTPVKLGSFYDLKHAEKVIRAAMADYIDEFSTT